MAISGTIRVTAAGTRVQAAIKGNVRSVVYKARSDNTGNIYLGGSDVSSTDGMTLVPGPAAYRCMPEAALRFSAESRSAMDYPPS